MDLRSLTTSLLPILVLVFASPAASAGEGAQKAQSLIPKIDLGGYFFGGDWLSNKNPGLDSCTEQDELGSILLKQCVAIIACLSALVLALCWPKLREARLLSRSCTGPSRRFRR